ncbi:hypothetical protein PAAG_11771 [Paracoccidioides lutzii Pb01]|uniref:Uncharacterized protein n=1 Tax=Paracoccidioides lutzii (strain ATCC MYA-826 / Pb01) TaxID=502779 RepID=A0A0A2VKX7_PARBA|nr:hypothetical protein PAAG_11771 [Paracoccidioides lutzii Pb01]KGQ01534.1 hypothetical protein PAAG_11771 [Paracoccidioides lutzii Pb01]
MEEHMDIPTPDFVVVISSAFPKTSVPPSPSRSGYLQSSSWFKSQEFRPIDPQRIQGFFWPHVRRRQKA